MKIIVALLMLSASLSAQTTIAVFDSKKAIEAVKKSMQDRIERQLSAQKSEIDKVTAEAQALSDALSAPMLPEKFQNTQREAIKKQLQLQGLTDKYQAAAVAMQQRERSLQERVGSIIATLAKSKGINLVIDRSQFYYAESTIDLTNDVIATVLAIP